MSKAIDDAMWSGDTDRLNEIAPCRCCCHEHTYADCPARAWNGCRGQYSWTRNDDEAWARHYQKHHGMSYDEFYGFTATEATTR